MERQQPMSKYMATGILALVILVAALPVYAVLEQVRMDGAQQALRQQFVAEGADMYVTYCARCHGAGGEGIGPMPALNNPALAQADRDILYATIAHAPHGTAMSAWHVDEGGALSSYQVEGLVTLITNGVWERAEMLSAERGFVVPTPAAPEVQLATMEATGEDPHECQACHEEPDVHANRFGLNCSRCHTLDAWKPAYLTRHTFYLDHGGEGKLACQTCHADSYATNTCYGCHDHEPGDMEVAHAQEEIYEFDDCAECHPTGQEDEAARLGYGLSGQASNAVDDGRGGGGEPAGVLPGGGEQAAGGEAGQASGNRQGGGK